MTLASRKPRLVALLLAAVVAAALLLLPGCGSVIRDVDYGSAFLDSVDGGPATCDIYPAGDFGEDVEKAPVFIYVHGGGYIRGSKNLNDASTMGKGIESMVKLMGENGWTVVLMDYALAPAYTYPTPVIQLAELVMFLQEHEDEYSIDMSRVVLGGGSAGAQIASQFTACQLDAAYAEECKVPQVIDPGRIKALYMGCALIDPTRFAQTGDAENDAKFAEMQAAYFGAGDAEEANLLEHLSAQFPPCYIVDSADASFAEQARDLAAALDALGVRNELRIYEDQYHGFDASGTDDATAEAVHGWLAFIRS